MSSWVLPIVIFACLCGAVTASASGDRDGDGLPDRWEKRYHLSPGKPSGKADPDRDHLSNRREYRLRTNPRNRDTDGDDYNDRIEVRKGTNPRARSSHPESFPSPASTGVPTGWKPARTRSTDMTVTTPGAVVQDVRFTNGADLFVEADNVTVRRVEFQGGLISNDHNGCHPGMLLEQVSMSPPDHAGGDFQEGAIGYGAYTARRVEIQGRSEGFRGLRLWPGDDRELVCQDRPARPLRGLARRRYSGLFRMTGWLSTTSRLICEPRVAAAPHRSSTTANRTMATRDP